MEPTEQEWAWDPETQTRVLGPVCKARSEEFPGFGSLVCELKTAHEGPHREREDGLVWDDPWTGRQEK